MTRYVIGPDVAIRLAHDQAVIRGGHQVLAPALLRSQVLSHLYQAVRRGEMTRKDAERQLEYVRGLRIRLLGDRVLQNVAWKAAGLLGWPDTFDAEYVALTQLHADALTTLDRHLADAVKDLVTIAPIEALYGQGQPGPGLGARITGPGQQKPGCLRVLVEAVRLPDLAAGLLWRHGGDSAGARATR